jgi:hypothetical protein
MDFSARWTGMTSVEQEIEHGLPDDANTHRRLAGELVLPDQFQVPSRYLRLDQESEVVDVGRIQGPFCRLNSIRHEG